jgi:ATP-dependent RNA helicase DHX34
LYSEEEYETMAPYTTPEILRVPLDSLLLQMVSMGLPDARKFPFVEAPPAESIEQSIKTLKEQVIIYLRLQT